MSDKQSKEQKKDVLLCDRACITTGRCSGNCTNPLKTQAQPLPAVSVNTVTKPWHSLKSDPVLLAALKNASEPTSSEVREQIIGVVAAEVGISKERVRDILGIQPESQNLEQVQQLKDHQIRDLVNKLTDVAKTYYSTQQLRDRISELVLSALKPNLQQTNTVNSTADDFISALRLLRDETLRVPPGTAVKIPEQITNEFRKHMRGESSMFDRIIDGESDPLKQTHKVECNQSRTVISELGKGFVS